MAKKAFLKFDRKDEEVRQALDRLEKRIRDWRDMMAKKALAKKSS